MERDAGSFSVGIGSMIWQRSLAMPGTSMPTEATTMSAIVAGTPGKTARMAAEPAIPFKPVSAEAIVSTVVAPDNNPPANDARVKVRPRIAVGPVIVNGGSRIDINTRFDRIGRLSGILVRDRRRPAQRLVPRRSHLRIGNLERIFMPVVLFVSSRPPPCQLSSERAHPISFKRGEREVPFEKAFRPKSPLPHFALFREPFL
jgi:hypothetical protein